MNRIGIILVVLLAVGVVALAGMRLLSPENEWRCENGGWVQHGQPSVPKPADPCPAAEGDGEKEQVEEVLVYFGNSELDPNAENCSVTYPVKREVSIESDLKQNTVRMLLQGPTEEEKEEGYFTSIPEVAELKEIVVEEGVATVDFTQGLEQEVGGSCRVMSIRSQITGTVSQFEEVEEVVVAVEGETEAVLQP